MATGRFHKDMAARKRYGIVQEPSSETLEMAQV